VGFNGKIVKTPAKCEKQRKTTISPLQPDPKISISGGLTEKNPFFAQKGGFPKRPFLQRTLRLDFCPRDTAINLRGEVAKWEFLEDLFHLPLGSKKGLFP
jgi:hypothetical protein